MGRNGGEEELQSSDITINGDDDHISGKDEGLDILKQQISSHSLYGLLVDSHLDCLQLRLGSIENAVVYPSSIAPPSQHPNFFTADQSELDQFMKVYCMTLKEVKEAIEEPQQESLAFINFMYSQLEDLLLQIPSSSTFSPITTSSGGES